MSRPTGPPAPPVPARLRAHSDHPQRLSRLAAGRPSCAGVWAGHQGPRAHLACARAPTPLPPGARRAQAPGPWEGAAPEQRPGARWLPTSRNAGPCLWAGWHPGPARPSAPAPTFPTPTLPYPLHPLPLPPPAPPTPQSFLPLPHSSPTLPSPTFSYLLLPTATHTPHPLLHPHLHSHLQPLPPQQAHRCQALAGLPQAPEDLQQELPTDANLASSLGTQWARGLFCPGACLRVLHCATYVEMGKAAWTRGEGPRLLVQP